MSACIQTIERCGSQEPTKVRPLDFYSLPSGSSVLHPGDSLLLTLVFSDAFATPGGWSGNPTMTLTLGYANAPANLVFTLNVAPLPDLPADLGLIVGGRTRPDGTIQMDVFIGNEFGLVPSGDITLDLSISATRSATDLTPVPLAVPPLAWTKKDGSGVEIASGTCTPSQSAFVCRLPFLEAMLGQLSSKIFATLIINPSGAGQVTVSGSVSSRIAEGDYANNESTKQYDLVPPPPEFDLSPRVDLSFVGPTYFMSLSARNVGPAAASDVVMEVVLPGRLRSCRAGSPRTAPPHARGARRSHAVLPWSGEGRRAPPGSSWNRVQVVRLEAVRGSSRGTEGTM